MAMMTCPECGKQISSTAKVCPQCGCTLSICPDCGAVYAGEKESCDQCGYRFGNKAEERKQTHPLPIETCRNKAKRYETVETVIYIVCILFLVAGGLTAFFAVPKLIEKIGTDLFGAKKQVGTVCTVLALCCAAVVIGGGDLCFRVVWQAIFASTIRNERESYSQFLLQTDERTVVGFYGAVEFSELPQKARLRAVLAVLTYIVFAAGAILLTVWATDAVKDYFAKLMLAYDPDDVKIVWDFKNNLFILGCIFAFAGVVVHGIRERIDRSPARLAAIQQALKN